MGDTAPSTVPAFILSLVRHVLTLLGGLAIGKGWLDGGQMEAVSAIALAAVPLIWSFIDKTQTKKKLQAAIDAPSGASG